MSSDQCGGSDRGSVSGSGWLNMTWVSCYYIKRSSEPVYTLSDLIVDISIQEECGKYFCYSFLKYKKRIPNHLYWSQSVWWRGSVWEHNNKYDLRLNTHTCTELSPHLQNSCNQISLNCVAAWRIIKYEACLNTDDWFFLLILRSCLKKRLNTLIR